jgi:putative tryptophan/tyrosine transport system substrate-binding protein
MMAAMNGTPDRRGSRHSRRQFVVAAGAAGLGLAVGCGVPLAQPARPARVARIGILVASSAEGIAAPLEAFLQGLRELGYVAGQNITIEPRYADGNAERLPGLAAELVRADHDVILAVTTPAALAAKNASTTVPIVFVSVGDPVATGLVASLARPGGNVTGQTGFGPVLAAKRLQLLTETVPGVVRVAVLRDPNPSNAFEWREIQTAADALGLQLQLLEVHSPEDLGGAFQAAIGGHADALFVMTGTLVEIRWPRIIEFTAHNRLPSMWNARAFVVRGGLMSYGPSPPVQWRRAAYYVDRILRGASPGDLPVEQPMTFEFVVNLKTAQALGLAFPNEIMLQVTEVIP